MMRRIALAAMFLFVCGARPAMADGSTCTISATNVVFGIYTGAATYVTGTITVKCTSNVTYYVGLNAGTTSGSTITNRRMTGPLSALLSYNLTSDASYTANWGNSSTTGWVSRAANGNAQALTVYALIPAKQNVVSGSFTDTITATVSRGTGGEGGTTSTTFTVTGSVVKTCAVSANPLSFGVYSGMLVDSTSTISVTCTTSATYNVGLSAGTATEATVAKRSMIGPGGALLGYKLFSNSAYTINWGNTVGTDTVAGTGNGLAQSLTVYGQIPAGEPGAPGAYTDTIIATITY
jgi:spore coat protein U-like protein